MDYGIISATFSIAEKLIEINKGQRVEIVLNYKDGRSILIGMGSSMFMNTIIEVNENTPKINR